MANAIGGPEKVPFLFIDSVVILNNVSSRLVITPTENLHKQRTEVLHPQTSLEVPPNA